MNTTTTTISTNTWQSIEHTTRPHSASPGGAAMSRRRSPYRVFVLVLVGWNCVGTSQTHMKF
jgi:hypothetical protein